MPESEIKVETDRVARTGNSSRERSILMFSIFLGREEQEGKNIASNKTLPAMR
jgi:hypothetical protein